MDIVKICILISSLSFFAYAVSYFTSPHMKKEFKRFINFNTDQIIINNSIKSTIHGLSLAWSYMPHNFEIECNNMKRPIDVFKDDELFKKVIRKRLKIGTFSWYLLILI